MPGIHPKLLSEFEDKWDYFARIPEKSVPLSVGA